MGTLAGANKVLDRTGQNLAVGGDGGGKILKQVIGELNRNIRGSIIKFYF